MSETELNIQRLVIVMYPNDTDLRKRQMYREALSELVKLARMEMWLATEQGWQQAKECLK